MMAQLSASTPAWMIWVLVSVSLLMQAAEAVVAEHVRVVSSA